MKKLLVKEGSGFAEIYDRSVNSYVEKASASASKGSITVESAYCIPIFLLAAVCLIWMAEIQSIQLAVKGGMQDAGKQMAEEIYSVPVFSAAKFQRLLVESIGEERLERSIVSGGTSGLRCGESYMTPGSRILELKTVYAVRIPLPVFAVPPLEYTETMRIKTWTGYEKSWLQDSLKEELVYITDTGVVYHKDPHCTYLEPSVRMISASDIETQRNEANGIYHPCEKCMRQGSTAGVVYVTDYGTRYHCSLQCSGLKRTVYTVPISETGGKNACMKCGK